MPIDFSPLSKKALHYAVKFAQQFNARLTVLKVLDPPPGIVNLQEAAFSDEKLLLTEKNLRALIDGSRSNGVSEAGFTVRVGIPSHEIVEAARELDVDLIVIGTHGYTGWKHFCIGSTAERVVRAAPCPVSSSFARRSTNFSEEQLMKTKLSAKATRDERPPRTSKKKAPKHAPRVQCLRRPSPSEFSCGFDETSGAVGRGIAR